MITFLARNKENIGTYLGIALISAAALLLQLTLLRLFAVQQFYHFAFMAVSLALLGAGASGSILTITRRRLSPGILCLAFGLTTITAYLIINYLPFDSFSIAWDGRQPLYLALYFLAAAVPFLFAGLLVGEALISAASHRVYAANLIGSAAGSLSSLALLSAFGGERAVIVTAVLGTTAAFFFPDRRLWLKRIISGLVLAGILTLWEFPALLNQQLSPYKTLSILSQALDTQHLLTRWDAVTRIDVIESSTIHTMPGLSLTSPISPPPQAGLLIDGDNLMPITRLSPDAADAATLLDHLPLGLAYRLRPQAETLIIEAGTGLDVLLALAGGAAQVTAVEENPLILQTMRQDLAAFTDHLYQHPRLTLINQSGRVYARQPGIGPFTLVIIALTDTHRPVTSGAYSLTENYLYTVEAMNDFWQLLDDNGLLLVTRWLQTPPSESGRLFGTMAAALAANNRDPAAHLLAFRTLRTITVLASTQPLSQADSEISRAFLRQRGFDAVYFPGIQPQDANQFNILPEPAYYNLMQAILQDPAATYADYRFDIRPPTDNRPFFFHYFKWRQTPEILATLGLTWQPFGGSGFFVLVALLLLVALAAVVFIIGPLWWLRWHRPSPTSPIPYWRLRLFTYFAALGLAFLFVEIPLAQRFILILGQPVTALAVVIFTLLLFSGLGSLTVPRWSLTWGLGILILLIGLYPLALPPLTNLALRWPEAGRISLTILTLASLGFFMGLPFAGGLRLIAAHDAALVPWAWAINGSFSVISAVLAVMTALSWGFATVLWLGAIAYALAFLALWPLLHQSLTPVREATAARH
jgi:hypothetical protein